MKFRIKVLNGKYTPQVKLGLFWQVLYKRTDLATRYYTVFLHTSKAECDTINYAKSVVDGYHKSIKNKEASEKISYISYELF